PARRQCGEGHCVTPGSSHDSPPQHCAGTGEGLRLLAATARRPLIFRPPRRSERCPCYARSLLITTLRSDCLKLLQKKAHELDDQLRGHSYPADPKGGPSRDSLGE